MNGLGNLYIVHISYNVCYQCNIIIGMSILTCYTDKQQPTTSNTLNTLRTMTSFLDWPRRFPVYMRLLTSAGVLPPPTTEAPRNSSPPSKALWSSCDPAREPLKAWSSGAWFSWRKSRVFCKKEWMDIRMCKRELLRMVKVGPLPLSILNLSGGGQPKAYRLCPSLIWNNEKEM